MVKLKVQIGRPLSGIEEYGRSCVRRPKLCIKSCRTIIIIRRSMEEVSHCTAFMPVFVKIGQFV
jgi:hypothetical protein